MGIILQSSYSQDLLTEWVRVSAACSLAWKRNFFPALAIVEIEMVMGRWKY